MEFIESIKILDNIPYLVELHQARANKVSKITIPDLALLNPISEGLVKCRIVFDEQSILSIEFHPYTLPSIESLKIVYSEDISYNHKYIDRSALASLYSQKEEADDIIICKNGYLTDSYFCNLVFSLNGELFTPNTPLLEGTKRQYLIESGKIKTRSITADDIHLFDGVYLINAMIDLDDNIFISKIV